MLTGEFAEGLVGAVMRMQAGRQVIVLTDVKFSLGILENVNPIHGPKKLAPSRRVTRTYNPPVNLDKSGPYLLSNSSAKEQVCGPKKIGSRDRARTCNPPVNSRLL